MTNADSAACEMLATAAAPPVRILNSDRTEQLDFLSHKLRCKIFRRDVGDDALALIFAVAVWARVGGAAGLALGYPAPNTASALLGPEEGKNWRNVVFCKIL